MKQLCDEPGPNDDCGRGDLKGDDRPILLFVLGMARSGTAALTRFLSLCGGTLPAGMLGANRSNPRGFWEPREAVILNKTIMRRLGSSWLDPSLRLQEEGAFNAQENARCIAKIRAYLATLPRAPLMVVKDPQITVLSGVWFEAAHQAGFRIIAVIAVRHPQQVIESMARFLRASPEFSAALWLKYNLLSERATRGLPRVFVEYPSLLDDWRREVKRISAALAIDLNPDEGAIERFLQQDLYRQRHCGPVAEPFGTDWISTVYEALSAGARDEPCDGSALERVFEAYRASGRFRAVFEEFHRFQTFSRLIPLSIERLAIEGLALAHRRKGTWA